MLQELETSPGSKVMLINGRKLIDNSQELSALLQDLPRLAKQALKMGSECSYMFPELFRPGGPRELATKGAQVSEH